MRGVFVSSSVGWWGVSSLGGSGFNEGFSGGGEVVCCCCEGGSWFDRDGRVGEVSGGCGGIGVVGFGW